MPEVAVATLGALLAEARAALAAAGVADAAREAAWLWAESPAEDAGAWLLRPEVVPDAARAARFRARVARRVGGEPLAYVSGWTAFRRVVVRCDRRALIPRPETEGLVELALGLARTGRVADIGTGTGCLALALADEGAFDAVLAVDRSADALALAAENARAARAAVALVRGDLTAPLAAASLDLLVANPPYLTEAEYAALDPSVRAWEPRLALPSGADGLDATRRLLDDGRRVLRRSGWLVLEVDARRAGETAALAAALGWTGVAISEDLFGRDRFVRARRGDAP